MSNNNSSINLVIVNGVSTIPAGANVNLSLTKEKLRILNLSQEKAMALAYSRITDIIISDKIDSSTEIEASIYLTLKYSTDGTNEIKSIIFKTTTDFSNNLEMFKNSIIDAKTKEEFNKNKPKKKTAKILLPLGAILICAFIVIIGLTPSTPNNEIPTNLKTDVPNTESTNIISSSTSSTASEVDSQQQNVPFSIKLSNGHFTAGIDFPAGTYNLEATKGGGNVSSSNLYSGGINAIMGVKSKNKDMGTDMYEQSYANIKLPKGTVLSLSSVTLKLTCDQPSSEPLSPREQTGLKTRVLTSGNYLSGEDFIPGIYDIVVVTGGGNVSSSNLYSRGINAIIGEKSKNEDMGTDMYEQSYKNIDLEEGVKLSVDGVKIKLIPSV